MPPEDADTQAVPVTALHASSIRAMSEFVLNPTPQMAGVVVRLLGLLAEHPERFRAPCGHNVYQRALLTWQHVLAHLPAGDGESRSLAPVVSLH
ncbi:MAG: hypothetical protein H6977_07080 [Gammaproteobacteria bacterium]|nr:hypothetical protein [Gammaproteobacteria bacterium]